MTAAETMKIVKALHKEGAESVEIRADGTIVAKFREAPQFVPQPIPYPVYEPRPWWTQPSWIGTEVWCSTADATAALGAQ